MGGQQRRASAGGASRVILVITACIIALMAAGVFAVRHVVFDVPARSAVAAAQGISTAVAEAFQVRPRIVVRGTTIIHQDSETLQLVTLERPLTQRHQWSHSWMGSTKTFEIEGDFKARAGFNLEKPFVIVIDPDSGGLTATLPDPEIFSVDLVNLRILTDADGLWNKLTASDREQAIADLKRVAAGKVSSTTLTQEARASAEKRLADLLATEGRPVTFAPAPKD